MIFVIFVIFVVGRLWFFMEFLVGFVKESVACIFFIVELAMEILLAF